jgi:hypothetical protein
MTTVPLAKPLISLAIASLFAVSAFLQSHDPAGQGTLSRVKQAVVGTIGNGIDWMSGAIASVLPYQLPEVQPNGDIVIKHVSPDLRSPADKAAPGRPEPVSGVEETNT